MTPQKATFKSSFTGREPFFSDHKILSKSTLPGMAYIEMARVAVAASLAKDIDYRIHLQNITFLSPIVIEEEKVEVEISLYPGNGEIGVEVSSKKGVHFQAVATVVVTEETFIFPKIEVEKIKEQCTDKTLVKQEIYEAFKKAGIDFGHSHQGIQNVSRGGEEAIAHLSLPGSSDDAMLLSPGMLDSAIQGGVMFGLEEDATLKIPFAIKKVEIYGKLEDEMVSHIVVNEGAIDIDVATMDGEVRVRMKQFSSREIGTTLGQDEVVYFVPQWCNVTDPDDHEDITVVEVQDSYERLVETIFEKVKGLVVAKIAKPHVIEVNIPEDKSQWLGIVALLKAAHLENSKIKYRLKHKGQTLDIDYRLAEDYAGKFTWQDQKTILITGGLGGLGLIFATDIATNANECEIILTGRSELDDNKKQKLKELEELGVGVVYHQVDVSNKEQILELFAKHDNINIILHSAGVIRDNFAQNKTIEEIQQVLAPKVKGIENLDEASSDLPLDYFIAFSSLAGAFGNIGQLDYSAANGYLDAFIHNRANLVKEGKRSGKSISINWPLWREGGMTVDTSNEKHMEKLFAAKALPTTAGIEALKAIMSQEQEQVLVLYGNQQRLVKRLSKKKTKAKAKTISVNHNKIENELLKSLTTRTANFLKVKPENMDETAEWQEYGFDSILLTNFVNELNDSFNIDLMPTVFFEAPNLESFSHYLATTYPQEVAKGLGLGGKEVEVKEVDDVVEEAHENVSAFARRFLEQQRSGFREEDVAIIGVSCRFPDAEGIHEFWDNIQNAKDSIQEIPAERWDWREHPNARKWGGFIKGVDEFDPLFFGISPAEAFYMSPEQRLLMEYVWKCLEDAGYAGETLRGSNTGIFIGVGSSEYSYMIDQAGMPIEGYSSTGMVPSVGPNRVSYLLDWHGPSQPIETACSSSLVALHRAVESIRLGNCDQAIVGGVNLLLTPKAYISFTKAGMLCEDGRCKTFSKNANGYVRGEGVGMIMVKSLPKAIANGDHIYAVVKGTAENHGGKTNSLTAPNPLAQSQVIQKAIVNSGLNANDITYIECHGTGTNLGDPIEINGLKDAYGNLAKDKVAASCGLGSVKSNIGHLEMAAGIAGVIKALLQMKHKMLVKSLHCEELNPYLKLEGSPFYVVREKQEWKVAKNKRRIAGVSSFGFGGVNAHVILEEYPVQINTEHQEPDLEPKIIVLSTKGKEQMQAYATSLLSFLDEPQNHKIDLTSMAYTLQVGRRELEERLAFVAQNMEELKTGLASYLKSGSKDNTKIYQGTVKGSSEQKLSLDDTEAGKKYIHELVTTKEHEKIAELWTKGVKINWDLLYQTN